ncbi:MAG TPA: GTPase/DUF3482 domain-containing protein [Oleiagrimonas sp.]|nr:GTPase/DUF3482 domain-containing protein [Oleiagrimonas sp.]
MSGLPRFAVVGHPNKGKSSIVATLAQNDGIAIALEPGTTRDSDVYPLRVDGDTLYELIDTPGFQRPRQALGWMREHSRSASDRPDTVRAFVIQHRGDARFHDECELLQPIIDGAGILYVVDGSVPYSSENEAEMDILRWTGRPSLALINHIGDHDCSASWEAALGQYFRIVRHFDAVRAPFEEHLGLLRGFGELASGWREPLERAVHHLREQRKRRDTQAVTLIAAALGDMLRHTETRTLREGADRGEAESTLRQRWRDWERQREKQLRQDIEKLYRHRRLERQERDLAWDADDDLFSERTRHAWGVSRAYLAAAGFGAGALGGAGIDALAVGHTLGAGTVIGGVLGAAGSIYYGGRLDRLKLGPLSSGGQQARFGPVRDPQFGYVVLGRALEHAWCVARRNHAGRDPLALGDSGDRWLQHLGKRQRMSLQKALLAPPRDAGDARRREAMEAAIDDAMTAFDAWRAGKDVPISRAPR